MKYRGFIKTAIAIGLVIVVGIAAGSFYFGSGSSDPISGANMLTFEVFRGEFVSTITESGDVESSENVEIRCAVKERGGTTILKIADEGSMVEQGDFLVQLDDTALRDELIEQEIEVARDKASKIQAEQDLVTAKSMLKEFESGVYAQELDTLLAELAFAEETLKRARDVQRYSENLARKGYVTKTQLEADQFAVEKASKELDLTRSKVEVYRTHTKERMEAELQAEIDKQEANLEAAEFTLKLSTSRLKYYQDQVDACHLVAPAAGQVVYANEIDGRGDDGIVIEEGVVVRDGQPLIHLPNPDKMQVTTKVNDSKINAVCVGQPVTIRLDTAPETPIEGIVSYVASFPEPRRWYQAPIEYEIAVEITEKSELVRPGLRAKVEVFVERIADVIQAPVSSLINNNGTFYVVVSDGTGLELRQVSIGSNNEAFVVIEDGLSPGENVLVDPDSYRDQLDLPTDS